MDLDKSEVTLTNTRRVKNRVGLHLNAGIYLKWDIGLHHII